MQDTISHALKHLLLSGGLLSSKPHTATCKCTADIAQVCMYVLRFRDCSIMLGIFVV